MTIPPTIGRVAALVACALALSLGTAMAAGPASAATTAGTSARMGAVAPANHAVQPLASVHNCKVAGSDGTTQGVFCADIVDEGGGNFLVKTEAYCQNVHSDVIVQCGDIQYAYEGASANFGGAFAVTSLTHFCGHTAGACPTNHQRFVSSFPASVSCDEVWTVVLSGARIQLPGSDKVVTLTANFASAHAVVC